MEITVSDKTLLNIFNECRNYKNNLYVIPKDIFLLNLLKNNKFSYFYGRIDTNGNINSNHTYSELVYLPSLEVFEEIKTSSPKDLYSASLLDYDDYLSIEFPDEETAFYFKLKYCSNT